MEVIFDIHNIQGLIVRVVVWGGGCGGGVVVVGGVLPFPCNGIAQ